MSNQALNRLRGTAEVLLVLCADALVTLALFYAAIVVRRDILPHLLPGVLPAFKLKAAADWWILPVWLFFFSYEGLYTKRFLLWDEIKALWKVSFFATVGVFTIVSIGKLSGQASRTVIVLMGLISLAVLPPVRIYVKKALRGFGLLKRKVLILGAGETGMLIARALKKEPNYGYSVVGYLDDDPAKIGSEIDGVKVHQGVDSADKYIESRNITDIIVAMPEADSSRLRDLINGLQHKVDRILFVPDITGMAVGTSVQYFFQEQAVALEVKNNLAAPVPYLTKRTFDRAVGALLLLILAAPMLVIAALIRITSRGPAIYRQQRIGRHGRTFTCYKFRTMFVDAEERLKEILATDPAAKAEWEAYRKLKDDPRVTGVGRFLRSTSLDELPQLLNVLKGEMSLVGPRPVTKQEIDEYYKEMAEVCFSIPPGITGLWQVSGRSNTSYDYRVALDSWYVRNWSLWLDIVVLLRTIKVVFTKEGAR